MAKISNFFWTAFFHLNCLLCDVTKRPLIYSRFSSRLIHCLPCFFFSYSPWLSFISHDFTTFAIKTGKITKTLCLFVLLFSIFCWLFFLINLLKSFILTSYNFHHKKDIFPLKCAVWCWCYFCHILLKISFFVILPRICKMFVNLVAVISLEWSYNVLSIDKCSVCEFAFFLAHILYF